MGPFTPTGPESTELDDVAFYRRLSPSSRTALEHADAMRRWNNQDRLHMEHLVMGLYQKVDGPTQRLLHEARIDDRALREILAAAVEHRLPGPQEYTLRDLTALPRQSAHVRAALIAARRIADDRRSEQIQSRHLLYGVLSVEDCDVTKELLRHVRKDAITLTVPPLPPAAILHSDLWARDDALGFKLYAKAIAEFVDQKQTNPPLTVAILAPWGRGKTTLMRLVREELAHKADVSTPPTPPAPPSSPTTTFGALRRWLRKAVDLEVTKLQYPTVWFNAWKFQNSEQVWAGLAHEIISQLVEQLPKAVAREKFWLSLQLRRVDSAAILRDLRGVALERIAGQLLSWATLGLLAVGAGALGLLLAALPGSLNVGTGAALSALGGTVGSLLIQAYRVHADLKTKPLEGAYAKYVRQPDYAGKRGTLVEIEEDIRVVFDLLVDGERPAVVFIDDLDRCSPGKVAEVMEAVNLFLSGDFPHCYFVIGMDAQVVAASMDVAHKELTEKLAFVARGYGSLGWYFMDKFIQLPFVIPSLTDAQRVAFLGQLFERKGRPTPQAAALADRAEAAVRALGASEQATSNLVQQAAQAIAPLHQEDPERARRIAEQALEAGARRFRDEDPEIISELSRYAEFLGPAPRTIKRFANLYRFYRMVQWSRELQGLDTAPPPALGRWLTLMLRWPQLVRWIQWEGEAHLFPQATDSDQRAKEFETGVLMATSHGAWLDGHGLRNIPWCADGQLFDFLRATQAVAGQLTRAVDQGVW